MQFNFFAAQDDMRSLWRSIFEMQGMRLLEAYSRPDQQNRWFDDWGEIERLIDEGQWHFTAWPSHVGGPPLSEQIAFDEATQLKFNAAGRTVLHSPAFINYSWIGEPGGCLGASSLSCWNEAGARQRANFSAAVLDAVDWKLFRSVFSKIQRQVRGCASHTLHAAPIMPSAWSHLQAGEMQLWGWGDPVAAGSPLLLQI